MEQTLYYNGRIMTMDSELPKADYMVVRGERIEALGSEESLEQLCERYGEGERVDLGGRLVVPGLIDSHMHMLTGALTKMQVDLNDREFQNSGEVLDYIKKTAHPLKSWVQAFGFDEKRVCGNRLLTREELDRAFPHRPVIVTRVCGHLSMINTVAIQCLDPVRMDEIRGGEFQRDESGRLTGVVTEAAQQFVLDNILAPEPEIIMKLMDEEQKYLLSKGICSIHDAGTDQLLPEEYVELYREYADSGRLKLRVYLMARPTEEKSFEEFADWVKELKAAYPPEESRLFFGAVKLFADGSIGGRTAAIHGNYEGDADNHGLLLEDRLRKYIGPTHREGLQLAVHAIGDRATEFTADLMIQAMAEDDKPIRHRIEHAELQNQRILDKLVKNGLSVMTQPGFIGEFQDSYRNNLGEEEALRIQPLKTMLKMGIPLGFGSDYPVIDPSPLYGIRCALSRKQKDGGNCLNEEESINFEQALRCYTAENARASYTEHLQGSLSVGKFADFVVLDSSGDSQEAGDQECLRVLRTVVAGETLYEREG